MKYAKKKQKKKLKEFATTLALAFAIGFYSSDAKNALFPQENIVVCLYCHAQHVREEQDVCNEENGFYKQGVILTMPLFGSSKEFQIKVMVKKRSSRKE